MKILNGKKVRVLALTALICSQLGITSYASGVWGVDRIQGNSIYETSAMLSEKFGSYDTVILINVDNTTADGLSAAGLSGAVNAPIFAVKKDSISYEVSCKVNDDNVKKVYIIGGENSISQDAIDDLYYGQEVVRLSGDDRIKTSYKVANEVSNITNVNKVFYANAWKGEPDTMSVSSVAAREKAPIIQTDGKDIPFTENIQSYVVGGSSTMSDNIVKKTQSERIGGVDRFATNKLIIQKFYQNADLFHITKAYDLKDAMIAAPVANKLNKPVVLVHYGSDKSILKGARNITAIGNITHQIREEAHEASRGAASKPIHATFKPGTYLIGRDLEPGEYLITSNKNDLGYYEVKNGTSSNADIIDNGFASPNTYVTVEKGQYLEIQRATAKIARFNSLPSNQTSVKDGMYIVGKDIKAGEYKVQAKAGKSAYWSISKNSDAKDRNKLLANNLFEGTTYVTVEDGEYLELRDISQAAKIK